MVAKSLDKSAGVLSILWTVGGYGLLRFEVRADPRFFGTPQFAVLLFIWFGVSLLLVTAGLRRGNVVGRMCSLCSIGVFLWLTEPIHGLGRGVANFFRKDEYASIYFGAPECRVKVALHTDQDVAIFLDSVRQFARQRDIRKCRQKYYGAYSGPPRPTYKGKHLAIWSSVGWGTDASQKSGSIRLAPFDEAYPVEDFKRLADGLATTMRSAFSNRVEVTYKEAQRP